MSSARHSGGKEADNVTSLLKLGRKPRLEAANVLPVTEYLRALEMFRGLPQVELEQFGKTLAMRECSPGTVFFRPEDSSERLFILKTGEVDLYRLNRSGKRMVLARLRPMAVFGEMGVLGQTMHGCFAESVGNSLVCVATRDEVVSLLRQHPETALRLMEAVGVRLKAVEERLAGIALRPVQARLASALLSQVTPDTCEVSGFSHADLGDMIGALRQTVTQTLAAMQRDGLVEVGHKTVRVLDVEGMRRLARAEE
jgi:CRP/FNR family transcriptional regulator